MIAVTSKVIRRFSIRIGRIRSKITLKSTTGFLRKKAKIRIISF